MTDFLISRLIAVSMTFLSLIILGWVASRDIPVSLMPDIDIPEITIQVSYPNLSARQMENTITAPVRRQLLQIPGLDDMISESRAGHAIIRLRLDYGTDMHFAFVTANEKIDMAMQSLPNDIDRPRIIKASAVDIPVFRINVSTSMPDTVTLIKHGNDENTFLELSRFTENVVRRRIEQLPEVALVDISGLAQPEIVIIPDTVKMENLGLTVADIDKTLDDNNKSLGSILVRDGQYQYHIRVASTLTDKRDVGDLYINKSDRLFRLGDIAVINTLPVKERGLFVANGKRAVTMSVIKQSEARMETLKEKMTSLISQMETDYPELDFELVRDQSRLLDMAISGLGKSLLLGGGMAFLVLFFFLKDARAPLLIGITIPVSVIVSLLFFDLAGLSINIVSLSGLVLGVGMMIDNSIIVIDNISQYADRGAGIRESCIEGTNEVIRPLLSSVLTTCAVFLPLILLSGISGAIFYDQAMAVTIGLFTSLGVSITLLPVYFSLIYRGKFLKRTSNWLKRMNPLNYEGLYSRGYQFIFTNKLPAIIFFIILAAGAIWFFPYLKKEKFPRVPQSDILLHIDWNENINIAENRRRTLNIMERYPDLVAHYNMHAGEQQFLLNRDHIQGFEEVSLYIESGDEEKVEILKNYLTETLLAMYPSATFTFERSDNIFEQAFSDDTAPLEVHLIPVTQNNETTLKDLLSVRNRLKDSLNIKIQNIRSHREINIRIDHEKLLLYHVATDNLLKELQSALNETRFTDVRSSQNFIPVRLGLGEKQIENIVSSGFVRNDENMEIPIRLLVTLYQGEGLKDITGGKEGEYFPFKLDIAEETLPATEAKIKQILGNFPRYRASFKGSIYANRELVKEMAIVMVVSLLLLYFILAAQFESLWQPVIVLTEIPVNLTAAFFMLYLFDSSVNIMSLIGMVVMSGIVINDSILKIDTINRLLKSGYSLTDAIKTGGERRLKPILMTSLTTILALLPFLFTEDLGSVIQKPLALSVIGGMLLGTFVSLYYVPLFYYLIKSKMTGKRLTSGSQSGTKSINM